MEQSTARIGGMSETGRASQGAAIPLLPIYLRQMGETPLLTTEGEVKLATELHETRAAFARAVLKLPATVRREVLGDDAGGPRLLHDWPIEDLENCYRELVRLARKPIDARLAVRITELKAIKRRVDRARDGLILANLRLVTHIAKRYVNQGIAFMDLIQEGNIGLMRAVEKFDHRKGYKFSTYAYWWIKQAMTRAIADKARLIRIPVHLTETLKKVRRASERLSERLGHEPSAQEIADELGLPVDKVSEVLEVVQDAQPLESDGDESQPGVLPFIADPAAEDPLRRTLANELQDNVRSALGVLDEREREIIRLRFGFGHEPCHTLESIGQVINLSRERVRQLEAIALRKIEAARKERLHQTRQIV